MFRNQSVLRRQILWPLLIFEVVALFIIGLAIAYFYQGQFQSTLALQQETARSTAINVEEYIGGLQSVLELAGQNQDLMNLPSLQQQVSLGQIKGQHRAYENLVIVDHLGQTQTQFTFMTNIPPLPENWREHEAFLQAMAGNTYVSPAEYYQGLAHLLIAVPIRDTQLRIVGMLAAQIDLNAPLWEIIAPAGSGETGYTYVVNPEGNLIVSRNITLVRHHEEVKELTGVQAAIDGKQPGTPYVGLTNIIDTHDLRSDSKEKGLFDHIVVGGVSTLPSLRWHVVAELPVSEAYAYLFSLLPLLGIQLLIGLGFAIGVWFYVSKRVVNPILEMTRGAQIIGDGQLDHRIEVKASGELATLAHVLNATATQLRDLINSLEQRVSQRTRDLERRAIELEAASRVAREAATIRDVNELMDETTHLISVLFGFYHAGIFLLDDAREHAVLQAASSEGGRTMLARQHKLKVGEEGIVGYVAHHGASRIALDVGEDAVFFDNPDLPQTRSEIALPLSVREEVIGVLDVQSTEAAAFSDEDIAVLQTMADQLAVAIDNARLLEESQNALRELQTLYGQLTREAWQKRQREGLSSYRYT
ncbi:MAG TPA: GAF domain-containing protein, partial [Chloroflexi bacterium]|nr:GAF domain-containing protein [Chloroflexota bacterium]